MIFLFYLGIDGYQNTTNGNYKTNSLWSEQFFYLFINFFFFCFKNGKKH